MIMQPLPFIYLGLKFIPKRTLTMEERDFVIGKIRTLTDTPIGWDYDEFYEVAEKHGAKNIDLFEVDGKLRMPGVVCLFYYE
jgi:hypothetical protein